jgi:hypothetical protein
MWVVNATPRPLYPGVRDPVPIVQESGWAPDWSEPARKISPEPRFDPRTVPPVASRYADFFSSLFVLYPYFCVLIVLDVCLLSLLYNTHNTNIHAPGGIRTRNPSKRSPADPRLRPLGH